MQAFSSFKQIFNSKKRWYGRERHQSLSEEEKNRKPEYGWQRYKNLAEDEKQKLVQHRKIYQQSRKNKNLFQTSINSKFKN